MSETATVNAEVKPPREPLSDNPLNPLHILDHLVACAPLDEATRILFHHALIDHGLHSGEELDRARYDLSAATPIDTAFNDEALRELADLQKKNADLQSQLESQAAQHRQDIEDLKRLFENAIRGNSAPAPDESADTQTTQSASSAAPSAEGNSPQS